MLSGVAEPLLSFCKGGSFEYRSMRRKAFTIVELLVTLSVMGVLMALLLPAVQSARESARRASCLNHLKQLMIAEHTHESSHHHFPDMDFWHGTAPRPNAEMFCCEIFALAFKYAKFSIASAFTSALSDCCTVFDAELLA